jgi:aminoglycoside phosphotransferase (APT) family kinase protein
MSGASAKALDSSAEGDIRTSLERLIGRTVGGRVANFHVMEDGHAGLTFSFDVVGAEGRFEGGYVLKVAPRGVKRRGNTDVHRQAPLLRALKRCGLPVPDVPWASASEDDLGAPFIVMDRLPGRVFVIWEPHASFSRDERVVKDIWLQSAALLARIHRVDWKSALGDWEAPQSLSSELERWPDVLRHAQDPAWLSAGEALGNLLRKTMPEGGPVGVVHGDFQPGNILFHESRATAVIDWELASIGAQGLDVGWLLMMSDPLAWHEDWRPVAPVTAHDLVEAYREAGGTSTADLGWHQALAHFRLGAIGCLNVKLHRSGKRIDSLWERFAPSITPLFGRGLALAERASAQFGVRHD